MDSSPNQFGDGDKEDVDDIPKNMEIMPGQGLDEILAPSSLYDASIQMSNTDLTTAFSGDIKFDPDSEFSKNDKQKKKEIKSKKEIEEEEREKMQ